MQSRHDSDAPPADLPPLNLPELGETADEVVGLDDDHEVALSVPDDGDDPFDDAAADDIAIDVVLSTTEHEPSAIGDDATGLDGIATHEGVSIEESEGSLIDTGDEADAPHFEGDDELGIDPIPREVDDGGLEGLVDPAGDRIDDHMFPPLDGDEDDDEEIDLGIELSTPPPSDEGESPFS